MLSFYVTHPEVVIDPALPSTDWRLSAEGRARAQAFADRSVLPRDARIVSSTERKTMETATILSGGRPFKCDELLRENVRPTGVLGRDAFDALFDAMFAHPDQGAGGVWESAIDTRHGVVSAVAAAIANASLTTIFVGHGSAGTFLKCHLAGRPLARTEDQRTLAWPGGGNIFAFDWVAGRLVTDWASFEDFALPVS